jgi:hypothetical protein
MESGWQVVSFVDYPLQCLQSSVEQARHCGTACLDEVGCDNMMIPFRLSVYLSPDYKTFFSYSSNVYLPQRCGKFPLTCCLVKP